MTTQTQRTPGLWHLPTPWAVDRTNNGYSIVTVQYSEHVAALEGITAEGDEIAKDNAAFIVIACNAHDELVAALRAVVESLDESDSVTPELFAQARAALAKVAP